MPEVMLVDNGSSRAASTLNLRRLAAVLGKRIGGEVHPVSLLHASKVAPGRLHGRPADTFEPYLRSRVLAGVRDFLMLPLFFGPSGALTGMVAEKADLLRRELGWFELRIADVLCPLPKGEPRLVQILFDNIQQTAEATQVDPDRVVLVDHGSPLPDVTEVRRVLAAELRRRLKVGAGLDEAVMERRGGQEFDFNGDLLEVVLRRLAEEDRARPVLVSMLFLAAGRHAGPGGDIEQICGRVEAAYQGFRVFPTPLVGSHSGLIDILESRYIDCYGTS